MSDWKKPAQPGMFEHEHMPERADDESFAGVGDGIYCHSCAFGEGDPKWGKASGDDKNPISWGELRAKIPHGVTCENCYRPMVPERAHSASECEVGKDCPSWDPQEEAATYARGNQHQHRMILHDLQLEGHDIDKKPEVPHLPEGHQIDFGSQRDLDGERSAGEHWKKTFHQRKSDEGHAEQMINHMFQDTPEAEFMKHNDQGPSRYSKRHTAYGETKAPQQVDTLRDDSCPVCGDRDSFDGDTCRVCGYVAPPAMFRDPDLDKAKMLDLRGDQQSAAEAGGGVGQNLPPVDPGAITDEGGIQGEEAGTIPEEEDGTVEGEVRGLGDAAEEAPVNPEELDEEGNPIAGGPEDPGAADRHFQQGGEPFTPGPNAPTPMDPMDPAMLAEDGQEILPTEGIEGAPGSPGDGVPDLLCPACGFQGDGAHPTSTPADLTAPADVGDGMLEGDICPQCQSATLMGVGAIAQEQQAMRPI